MTHTPDCPGDAAPWCTPACVAANRLVDVETAACMLDLSTDAVHSLVRRRRLPVAARIRRDRGRPALRFRISDLEALQHDTPDALGA